MSRPSVETTTIDVPPKEAIIDTVTVHTCLRNCMGNAGLAAGCCTVGPRDYIIGPIHDSAALLERLSIHYNRDVPYEEIFIDFEEGSAMFPERSQWQRPECFPALRLADNPDILPCIFLAEDNLCSIHEIRSTTCRSYRCEHLNTITAAL